MIEKQLKALAHAWGNTWQYIYEGIDEKIWQRYQGQIQNSRQKTRSSGENTK